MICSVQDVKNITGYTGTDKDDLIEDQIKIVEELIVDYTRNDYILYKDQYTNIYTWQNYGGYASGKYVFSGHTITGGDFSDFQVGDNILICDSIRNNGYFTVTDITGSVMTVSEDLSDEEETVSIFLVIFPKTLKRIAARMVSFDIFKRNTMTGLRSQTIGTVSYTWQDINGTSYPTDVGNLGMYVMHGGE
jgi:hypothetical protein